VPSTVSRSTIPTLNIFDRTSYALADVITMKLNIYATTLGLLGLATHTTALPRPQTLDGMIAAAATVRVMPFGASIVEGVRPLTPIT